MIYFIVEGQTDKALIRNILKPKAEKTDLEFLGLKGIDSVKKTIENLEELGLSQHTYFAIVDADNDFTARDNEMQRLTHTKEIDYYILPNHQDNGNLETLLLSAIGNHNIIDCFDEYEQCVKKDIGNKAKFYAYTTLEHNKRPEEFIETMDTNGLFDDLKTKLQTLFEGTE